MAASKFTPQTRGALIERTAAGVSLEDACRDIEVRLPTVKSWLARGRREDGGPYSDFVQLIEEARQQADDRPKPMDEAELLRVVSKAARKGSVQAMKLRWEMILDSRDDDKDDEKPADPLEAIDELAQRRATGA